MLSKSLLPAATLLALALAGPPTLAAEPDRVASVTVSYGDLNLSTDGGANRLHRRLSVAARRICRVEVQGQRGIEPGRRYRACVARAVDRAVQDVGSDRVTRLHHGAAALALGPAERPVPVP